MDKLQDYSSDEESEVLKSQEEGEEEQVEVDVEVEVETLSKPFFDDLDIYSQSYLLHSSNMISSFLYIPWNPSNATVNQLKRISQRAIDQIKKVHPEQADNYNWHYVGAPLATSTGKFSVTNKHNLSNFHITLSPNVFADSRKMKLFTTGVHNGIANMGIDKLLINSDRVEINRKTKLNSILGLSQASSPAASHVISLKFKDTLKVFRNHKTGNMFVSGILEDNGPQGRFLTQVLDVINENKKSIGLPTAKGLDWHISLVVGDYKGDYIGGERNGKGYEELVGPLHLDNTDELNKVRVNIDKIIINLQAGKRKDIEIKFPNNK